jgi:hypothetical protein
MLPCSKAKTITASMATGHNLPQPEPQAFAVLCSLYGGG